MSYDEETFEPVTDTPATDTLVEPQIPVEPPAEPPTEPEVTPAPDPNDQVRYEYWQSEATKAKNALAEMQKKLEPSSVDAPPVKPADETDYVELLKYNIALSEYTLKENQKLKESAQQTELQRQEVERQNALKQYTIAKLTEVNKSPQKSQQILQFFANSPHLQNPAVYDVMFDAAQSFLAKQNPQRGNIKSPPPPIGGGAIQDNKTPDDTFNESLGESKRFRL